MKKITSYILEFHPGRNVFRIRVKIEGGDSPVVLQINSMEEFVCCSLILQSGSAHIDQHGLLTSQG